MKYPNITKGVFLERPNRFIAKVRIESGRSCGTAANTAGRGTASCSADPNAAGQGTASRDADPDAAGQGAASRDADPNALIETVHVKNTGRCRELLVPGCEVWLVRSDDPKRKTRYDLVAVRKSTGVLFNIDSQAPNKVAREWLDEQGFDKIVPEYTYGESRLDYYMERRDDTEATASCQKYLMEVKGCTLEVDGIGYFPDAPTERGTKHVRELIRATKDGYHAILCFVIQMDGVTEVRPNAETDPAFAEAIKDARDAGVKIVYLCCHVEPDSMIISFP